MGKKDKPKKKRKDKAEPEVAGKPAAREKMSRKEFDRELRKLQVELAWLQQWVRHENKKIVVVFEGRDAAGKGGVIKRITERVSPRVFRVVALPAPTERERNQLYMQRYFRHFPAGGEVVIFDRSWYNRAGVEPVMGFCSEAEHREFLRRIPNMEREIVRQGVTLIKYFLVVGQEQQEERFKKRIEDPLRHWKLSPMDVESYRRWWEYTAAYDEMLEATDIDEAPWNIVRSDDKRRARLNCIAHLLSVVPYKKLPFKPPKFEKRKRRPRGVPEEPRFKHFVPEVY